MIATLLGLHRKNPSQTRSSPFLAGYPVGPASTSPEHFIVELEGLLVSPILPDESSLVQVLSK
jgi:hypothetical protein